MAGIGDTLRAERRRQGRTLADAAAETRVRESYLAAIEEEDFDVLGGDVYARGFIRLYGKYLSLDAESLVATFRAQHERAQEVTAIPGAAIDEVLPPPGRARLTFTPPVLAALALVTLLVVLFGVFRSGGGADEAATEDPNAPGPSPAEVQDQPAVLPSDDPDQALANAPADPLVEGPAPAVADGPVLEELAIEVSVLRAVRMTVVQGQPPITNATLQTGDVRQVVGDEAVVFQVSDAGAVDVTVNGLPLVGLGGPGQAVEVTCAIGQQGCQVRVL